MVSLGSWMNEILIDWGVDPKLANMFDETIIAVLMIGVSIGLDYLCQAIFVGGMKHYTKRAPHQWEYIADETQGGASSYSYLARYIGYFLLPLAFVREKRYWTSHRKYVRCISLLPYCSLSTACCW